MRLNNIVILLITLLLSSCSKIMDEQERVPVVVFSSFTGQDIEIEEEGAATKSEHDPVFVLDTICDDMRIVMELTGSVERSAKTYTPNTKTSWTTPGFTTTWTPSDNIGVYMRRSSIADPAIDMANVKYTTLASGRSVSFAASANALYYPVDVAKTVNFYAYYPYNNSLGTESSIVNFIDATDEADFTSLSYSISPNQTSGIASCDLMAAQRQTNKSRTSPVSAFTFQHKLCLFTIILQNTANFNGKQLTEVKLAGTKVTGKGTLNLDTGTLTPTATEFSPNNKTTRTLQNTSSQYIDFIINPCRVNLSSNSNGNLMKIVFTIGSNTYTIPVKGSDGYFDFLAGKRHYVTVNLSTP